VYVPHGVVTFKKRCIFSQSVVMCSNTTVLKTLRDFVFIKETVGVPCEVGTLGFYVCM
jgi:hypothetical protein